MSAEIIDIRTRRPWSPDRIDRTKRALFASRADCSAEFYDLLFDDCEDVDVMPDAPRESKQ